MIKVEHAELVYEICRIEAAASQRPIVPEPYNQRDEAFRAQFVETIDRLCGNDAPATTPEAEHDSWWRAYEQMGWEYGPVRDPVAKTHPDMVPFKELSKAERDKDEIFLAACDFAKLIISLEQEVAEDD